MQARRILPYGQKGAKTFLVKQAGGKWNSTMRVWEIHYDQAVALGLKKRFVKLED
jgi:hypothetical protein